MAATGLTLSGLHLHQPETFAESARQLEALGYHRYWATEHYLRRQCPNPLLLAAAAVAGTSTIRLGSAGVLLLYQSPRKVAADARLLRQLAGPRVDLGLVSAVVRDPLHAALLDGRPAPDEQAFATRVRAVVDALATEQASTFRGAAPPIADMWICGQHVITAELAGRLGLGFAVRHRPADTDDPTSSEGKEALDRYREVFAAAMPGQTPRIVVACSGMCDLTLDAAREAWIDNSGLASLGIEPPPTGFLGTPETCAGQLAAIARHYEASELVIDCLAKDGATRLRAFALLAEALEIRAARPAAIAAPSDLA